MLCYAHIHVGRYYRMANAATFDRSDFYYEPKVVANALKSCGVSEFIFSSISCQRHVSLSEAECRLKPVAPKVESQALFGTDLPIQGGFYELADDDIAKSLEYFYRTELSSVCASGYSEAVTSGGFQEVSNTTNKERMK